MPQSLDAALADVRAVLLDADGLDRAVAAGRSRAGTPSWQRVELRPVDLKAGRRLQIVSYDGTQAHTRNVEYGESATAAVDRLLSEPFGNWHVEGCGQTIQLRVTKSGAAQVHRALSTPTGGSGSSDGEHFAHDRAKQRLVSPDEPFLRALGIAGSDGRVKPSRQAKYRQVEEFVRVLSSVLPDVVDPGTDGPTPGPFSVLDLGCGNAYLTFAAYNFLSTDLRLRDREVLVIGVDVKAQAVRHGEAVARELGWSESVRFVEGPAGTAGAGPTKGADIVMALHACDTATDEALARGVRLAAPAILAAPCCHHDVQRQLSAGDPPAGGYGLLVRQPILRERFADVLTDAARAALLRLLGYRVDVVEFVGSEHTPRNTLIKAVRTGAPPTAHQIAEYLELTRAWGVLPRLEQLLAAELTPLLPDRAPGL